MVTMQEFYDALFAPLIATYGPLDRDTLTAVVGFDAGGPVSLCTVGYGGPTPTLFVTCELAVRREQIPSKCGRYELLAISSDEEWARSTLTNIAEMTFEFAFGHLHTLDIGPWVEEDAKIQGILFTEAYTVVIAGEQYAIFRCSPLTRDQLERAMDGQAEELATELGILEVNE
jgi:hypothetical protein